MIGRSSCIGSTWIADYYRGLLTFCLRQAVQQGAGLDPYPGRRPREDRLDQEAILRDWAARSPSAHPMV